MVEVWRAFIFSSFPRRRESGGAQFAKRKLSPASDAHHTQQQAAINSAYESAPATRIIAMSYDNQALEMFTPLTNAADREGSCYFEFHPNEVSKPYACWLKGSLLVKDAAFDFFAECFHSASESFDYFGVERFAEVEISRLLREIDSFLLDIEGEPSREKVFSRYASMFTLDIWSEIDTQVLASRVRDCGASMRSFIHAKTQESKCLWVMGM
jgi:hypothetical protein